MRQRVTQMAAQSSRRPSRTTGDAYQRLNPKYESDCRPSCSIPASRDSPSTSYYYAFRIQNWYMPGQVDFSLVQACAKAARSVIVLSLGKLRRKFCTFQPASRTEGTQSILTEKGANLGERKLMFLNGNSRSRQALVLKNHLLVTFASGVSSAKLVRSSRGR